MKTIEKQRKYHIVNLGGTPSGKTIMCALSKAKHMMSVMGVKFMRHLKATHRCGMCEFRFFNESVTTCPQCGSDEIEGVS